MSEINIEINPANREDTGRNPDGTFKSGISGNPSGRPKNTLKDYVRQKFMEMDSEEKEEFLKKISPDLQWRMGEGNPKEEIGGNIDMPFIIKVIKDDGTKREDSKTIPDTI